MRDEAGTPASAASRLPRSRRVAIYMIGVGVWVTGVLWLLFHYFVVHRGPFGPTVSPLEAWWLTLHGAFAFGAIWIVGVLWGVHIPVGWSGRRRHLSGGLLVGILAWLIISGYLLYYLGDEQLRAATSFTHWLIGLIVPIGFLVHRLKRRQNSLKIPSHRKTSSCSASARTV
jgi:hypothetical protein